MALFELLAKIKLEGATEAKRGLEDVGSAAHKTAGALSSRLGGAIKELGGHFVDTAGKAALLSTAVGGAIGAAAFQAAAKMDSLTRGLASVSKNSADLQGQLARLREVAKLPGLGFEEAVQGSVALQAAGISARLSERSLMAFGNALASVGKGKADLDGVTLALQQIASKGKISAEEINQLNERVPQIRKAMQAAFGTSDTEALGKMGIDTTTFINGVVTQLERLPRVTGGIQNDLENLSDAINQALIPLGKGIADLFSGVSGTGENLIATFKRVGTQIGEVLSAIGKSGVLAEVGKSLAGIFGLDIGQGLQQNMARVAGVIASVLKNLPEMGKMAADYFSKVWDAATQNIGIAFSNLWAMLKSGFSNIFSDIKADFYDMIGKLLQSIPHLPGAPSGLFATGQKYLDMAQGERNTVAVPDLQKLVDMPKLSGSFAPLLKDADAFTNSIVSKIKPYSQLPEGLNYGGGASTQGGGMNSIFAEWDKNLAKIEANTKATANALDSRRVFGGGELAKMGVTEAERQTGRPDPYTRSVDASLRSAIHRLVRADRNGTNNRSMPLYAR